MTDTQNEQAEQEVLQALVQGEAPDELQCRLHLLGLSKEILEHQSHLMWETHKEVVQVSIDDVIEGAGKLLAFALGR
tara:strand:- start:471 stop:701 length:231 start_codon:yes stop_codon:yes gene_type:complete